MEEIVKKIRDLQEHKSDLVYDDEIENFVSDCLFLKKDLNHSLGLNLENNFTREIKIQVPFTVEELEDLLQPFDVRLIAILRHIFSHKITNVDEEFLNLFKKAYPKHRCQKGTKLTRVLRQVIDEKYDYLYNQIADILSNNYLFKKTYYVTTNPYEFFIMGCGRGFNSCMSFYSESGYRVGILNHAAEPGTFLIIDKTNSETKNYRQLIHAVPSQGGLIFGRTYGNNSSSVFTKEYRYVIKRLLYGKDDFSWTRGNITYGDLYENHHSCEFYEDDTVFPYFPKGSWSGCLSYSDRAIDVAGKYQVSQ